MRIKETYTVKCTNKGCCGDKVADQPEFCAREKLGLPVPCPFAVNPDTTQAKGSEA